MQHRSEETKACILRAAQVLFARNGYDATGVAEICSEAKVSKGAFYHHFSSKQTVFLTLLEEWLAILDSQMIPLLETSQPVPQSLQKTASLVSLVFDSAQGQLPMFLEFWREASHDPIVWKATVGPFRHYQELFTGIFKRGIQENSLKNIEPSLASRVILALALGLILQGVIDPDGADWREVTQKGIHLLFEGLAK